MTGGNIRSTRVMVNALTVTTISHEKVMVVGKHHSVKTTDLMSKGKLIIKNLDSRKRNYPMKNNVNIEHLGNVSIVVNRTYVQSLS
jgi:hypothetical protein